MVMDEIGKQLQQAFYELGLQLGRELAARMIAGKGADATVGTGRGRRRVADASRPPPSKPKILPGLAGRRRKPGEAPPPCGRAGCGKPSRTRGYCQTHYVQWLKAGDGDRRAS